jgi:hypothetical protein
MKKTICILLSLCLGTAACKDDTEGVTTRIVTPSFPGLVLKGEPVVSTGIGSGTFTDPGATGIDSIANTTVELQPLSNDVDLTKPGFYSVQYEAKNVYGYRTNVNRLVLVSAVPATDDISGTYRRIPNNQEVTLTKAGTGLYIIDNIGGVPGDPGYVFPVYVGVPTENVVAVPPQANPFGGNVSVTEGTLKREGNTITFSYRVQGAGFSTTPRTFVKVD